MTDESAAVKPTPETTPESPFRSVSTPGFVELLETSGISLLVTTYQAGKLMAIRAAEGRITTLLRNFERPMGLALQDAHAFALGTRSQVWFFRNAPAIAPQLTPHGRFDACFVPRVCHVTGDIRCHEMAWIDNELWIVNTFFSCLCTLDMHHSFVPRGHPPFLAGAAPGDHCHLNGLAAAGGKVRYVTALAETSAPQGWRTSQAHGGVLIDVVTGNIVSRDWSMPHSPRIHAGLLWVLESGTGQLHTVSMVDGKRTMVVPQLPGFARGLAFFGPYAFVGLSRIRETTFGDLPIRARGQELCCGIWVVDVRTGQAAQFMRFEAGVEEIFAVEVLTGLRCPEILGLHDETTQGTFVLPPTSC